MDGKELLKKYGVLGSEEEIPKGLENKIEKLIKLVKESNKFLEKIDKKLEKKEE